MFRENYKKDNELIKPDAAFLKQLKKAVSEKQEEGKRQVIQTKMSKMYAGRFAVLAVCLVVVISLAVFRKEIWDAANSKGDELRTSISWDRMTENTVENTEDNIQSENASELEVKEQKIQQYGALKECLRQDVFIYELKDLEDEEAAGMEISEEEEEQLKAGILADTYTVVFEEKELKNPVYYVVSDMDGYGYWFAIDEDDKIWIR